MPRKVQLTCKTHLHREDGSLIEIAPNLISEEWKAAQKRCLNNMASELSLYYAKTQQIPTE